ncbi:MAG TPA: DUF2642 domain-containing protein [Bacillota bacterium]
MSVKIVPYHNHNGYNGHNGNGTPQRAFLEHLHRLEGHEVTVATTCGTVRGQLADVYSDHILVVSGRERHHIRVATICWVVDRGMPDDGEDA